jgi:lipid-A-disaccharide synthase-like uncharacterized protein
MDSLHQLIWHDGKFLGIEWSVWKVIGWIGNFVFFTRFFVQWYATEKRKQVVVPVSFWWLSLVGSLLILAYALKKHDSVFIFAYLFTWIPYIRNLIIHHRHAREQRECNDCGTKSGAVANFCPQCGAKLNAAPVGDEVTSL